MERRDIRADMLAAHAAKRDLVNRKKAATPESTHREPASDDDSHVCDVCGFEAKTAGGLGAHARTHAES